MCQILFICTDVHSDSISDLPSNQSFPSSHCYFPQLFDLGQSCLCSWTCHVAFVVGSPWCVDTLVPTWTRGSFELYAVHVEEQDWMDDCQPGGSACKRQLSSASRTIECESKKQHKKLINLLLTPRMIMLHVLEEICSADTPYHVRQGA